MQSLAIRIIMWLLSTHILSADNDNDDLSVWPLLPWIQFEKIKNNELNQRNLNKNQILLQIK